MRSHIHYQLKCSSDEVQYIYYSLMAYDTVESGRWLLSLEQEMKVAYSSETSVTTYQTAQCHFQKTTVWNFTTMRTQFPVDTMQFSQS